MLSPIQHIDGVTKELQEAKKIIQEKDNVIAQLRVNPETSNVPVDATEDEPEVCMNEGQSVNNESPLMWSFQEARGEWSEWFTAEHFQTVMEKHAPTTKVKNNKECRPSTLSIYKHGDKFLFKTTNALKKFKKRMKNYKGCIFFSFVQLFFLPQLCTFLCNYGTNFFKV
jgi:hypothetical protein